MTRQHTTGVIFIHDLLPVMLEIMGALTTSALKKHTDKAGLCVVYRSAWPRERVVLAAHRFAVI